MLPYGWQLPCGAECAETGCLKKRPQICLQQDSASWAVVERKHAKQHKMTSLIGRSNCTYSIVLYFCSIKVMIHIYIQYMNWNRKYTCACLKLCFYWQIISIRIKSSSTCKQPSILCQALMSFLSHQIFFMPPLFPPHTFTAVFLFFSNQSIACKYGLQNSIDIQAHLNL